MMSSGRGDAAKPHYYWLDTMRFVAAFMVLLSHARNTFFPPFGDFCLGALFSIDKKVYEKTVAKSIKDEDFTYSELF